MGQKRDALAIWKKMSVDGPSWAVWVTGAISTSTMPGSKPAPSSLVAAKPEQQEQGGEVQEPFRGPFLLFSGAEMVLHMSELQLKLGFHGHHRLGYHCMCFERPTKPARA